MSRGYRVVDENGRLHFETVLFATGSGSFLNPFVYNRELTSLLVAAAAAGLVYLGLLHGRPVSPWWRLGVPVLVFFPVYGGMRYGVLRERRLRLELDRGAGRIRVRRDRLFGAERTELAVSEVRLLEVTEQAAPDESDIQDIVRWQQMAEPGVHAAPAPLFRLELVRSDGGRVLLFTDDHAESVDEVRRRLGSAMGLV